MLTKFDFGVLSQKNILTLNVSVNNMMGMEVSQTLQIQAQTEVRRSWFSSSYGRSCTSQGKLCSERENPNRIWMFDARFSLVYRLMILNLELERF